MEVITDRQAGVFSGRLTLYSLDAIDEAHSQDVVPGLSFDAKQIATACNGFYLPLWEQECDLLSTRNLVAQQWLDKAESYIKIVRKHKEQFCLLRIGRHSGAEAVTIEGARNIRIGRGRQVRYGEASTTLWLSSDQIRDHAHLIPFGWIVVGFQKI